MDKWAHFIAIAHIYTVFFLLYFFKILMMTLRMIQLEEEREKMDAVGRSVLIKGKE